MLWEHVASVRFRNTPMILTTVSYLSVAEFRISLCEMRRKKKEVVFAPPTRAHTTISSYFGKDIKV